MDPASLHNFIDSIGLECGEELKEKVKNNENVRMTAMQEVIYILNDLMALEDLAIPHKAVSLALHNDFDLTRDDEEGE